MNVLDYARSVANQIVNRAMVVVPILHADGHLMRLDVEPRQRERVKRATCGNKRAADYRPSGEREMSVAPQSRLDALQQFYDYANRNGIETSPFDGATVTAENWDSDNVRLWETSYDWHTYIRENVL